MTKRSKLIAVCLVAVASLGAARAQGALTRLVQPAPQEPPRPAQTAPEEPAGPASPADQRVNLNELPTRLENSVQVVRRVTRGLGPEVGVIADDLPELAAGLQLLLEESRTSVTSDRSPGLISTLRELWRSAESRLETWQQRLLAASGALEKDRATLAEQSRYLTDAQQLLQAEGVEADTLATIERVRSQVVSAEDLARGYRNTLLGLQAQLAELTIDIQLAEEEFAELAATEREGMLRLDAPPIWRGTPPSVQPETAAAVVERTATEAGAGELSRPERAALTYVVEYVTAILSQFIGVYLLFLVPSLLLRKRASVWREAERPSVRALGRALDRPFSAALLPAFIASTIWRGHVQVNSTLLLFPLLRVVPRLLPAAYARAIWGLATVWILDRFAATVLLELSTFRRLFELGLIGATIIGLVWLHRRLGGDSGSANRFRLARIGIRIGVAALAAALVAEVIGATALARYLQTGILTTVYGAVLLYAFLLMSRGFLDLLIESRPAQLTTIIQQAPADLPRKLNAGMRWVMLVFFAALVVETFQLTDPLLAAADRFMARTFSFGEIEFTVGSIVILVLTLAAAVLLSGVARFFLAATVYGRFNLQRGTSEVISKLLHYLLLTAGFLFALGAAGIDLNRFTILMGALGVGMGLGLQNIVSNFVSGLILLFERPLSVGDVVSVNSVAGVVADIGIRATRIRTWDGADVAVPNSNLISGEFTNWSLSDEERRSEVKVGVAYGTDPERVCRVLTEVAAAHPLVFKEPEPMAFFVGFGDSSLDFVLRYWTRVTDTFQVNSDMHTAVCKRLVAENITIPFPQRDLHVKEIDPEARRLVEPRSAEREQT